MAEDALVQVRTHVTSHFWEGRGGGWGEPSYQVALTGFVGLCPPGLWSKGRFARYCRHGIPSYRVLLNFLPDPDDTNESIGEKKM